MKNRLTAAIIAGGKSRRFGSQKLLAIKEGKRLIDYALELSFSLSDRILLVGDLELNVPDSVSRVKDLVPGCGPIGGIYTALESAKEGWVAVLPGDMPYLTSEVYNYLLGKTEDERPIVAVSPDGIEPLVSLWPVKCSSFLKERISKRNYKLREALSGCMAVEEDISHLVKSEPRLLLNINYQDDI